MSTRVLVTPDKNITLNLDRKKFKMFSSVVTDPESKPFKLMEDILMGGTLPKMAIGKNDYKEVKIFQRYLDKHPFVKNNFNEWFVHYTSVLSGNILPRDATTLKMEDIISINKYFKGLDDPNGLNVRLRHYLYDPRYLDELLTTKGMINKYNKFLTKPVPVLTDKGFVKRAIYDFTSPVGAIMKYHDNIERLTNIDVDYELSENGLYSPIAKFMQNFSVKEKNQLTEDLFKYRQEGIRPEDPKQLKLVEEYNALMTTFLEKFGDKWIYTKDSKGNKVSDAEGKWLMDTDFRSWWKATGGKLNKFMRWDRDGAFDLKHFRKTGLNNPSAKDFKTIVGVDGLKRYQFEHKIEKAIQARANAGKPYKDPYSIRIQARNKRQGIGYLDTKTYLPHINFGATKEAKQEIRDYIADKADKIFNSALKSGKTEEQATELRDAYITKQQLKIDNASELFTIGEVIESSVITDKDLEVNISEQGSLSPVLKARTEDMPGYDTRHTVFENYVDMIVRGFYKNTSSINGQYEIDNMMYRMRKYKPTEAELDNLVGSAYDSPVQVWADFIKLYLQRILGHQTYFSESMTSGTDPLKLKTKLNMFYTLSDEAVVKGFEKLYQSKWKDKIAPDFIKNAPADATLRKEHFSREIHNLGRLEAQYQLTSLLANTGTWSTNIFSGSMMTAGTGGTKNFLRIFSPKAIKNHLLTNAKGEYVVKLNDGTVVKDRKGILKFYEEKGVIDGFIKAEFETNAPLRKGLKNAGVNIKDFSNEIRMAIKNKKSVSDVAKKYGAYDVMVQYGSFIMQNSERINRLNAMIAHSFQAMDKLGESSANLTLDDPWVFDMGQRGIELSQFLYNNAFRNAPMSTSLGKVLSRFKVFVFNSIRVRKEFYRQAKLYNFKEGTESFERFKRIYTIDLFLFALASAFMFSVFDTTLSPPLDYFQKLGDLLYGDKRERDTAFWGSKLGPLQLLKPPIARIPDSAWELLNGETEKFANYTVYTMFPFGRGVRQIKQLSESPERVGEITLRLPVNQVKSRIERAEKRNQQKAFIESQLGE